MRSASNELCYFLPTVGCVYEKAPRPPKPDLFVSSLSPSSLAPLGLVGTLSATRSISLTTDGQDNVGYVTSRYMSGRRISTHVNMHGPAAAHGHNNMRTQSFDLTNEQTDDMETDDWTTTHEKTTEESRMQSKGCYYCDAPIKSRVSMDDPPTNHHEDQCQTKGPSATHQSKGPYRALERACGDRSPQSIK